MTGTSLNPSAIPHEEQRTGFSYLGIDFGTSNCTCCAVNEAGKLEFARLDGDDVLLPTVLFVPRANYSAQEVDEQDLEIRLRKAKAEERLRYQKDLEELASILQGYDQRNKPEHPKYPKREKDSIGSGSAATLKALEEGFQEELRKYEAQLENYNSALERYAIERRLFEKQNRDFIRPIASDATLRSSLRVSMQREKSEEAESRYWDQTFFNAIAKGSAVVFGREAIRRYSEDPMSGFFLRSPKSFLAVDLKPDYRNIFIRIVEQFLSRIKSLAEKQLKRSFSGVVLGRPVNYHGVRGMAGNNDALEIMRAAARSVGFEDVRFFFEPIAAAVSIPRERIPEALSLVVDVGGGTTDCSIFRREASSGHSPKLVIARSHGSRIGGTDFDQAIAWNLIMPTFGKNTFLKSGLPIPNAVHHDAISTRDLPAQIRFRRSRRTIEELIFQATEKTGLMHLLKMQEDQAQHRVILEAERIKILASSADRLTAHLDFIESGLTVQLHTAGVEAATRSPVDSVLEQVRRTVGTDAEKLSVVFVTGGMSQSPFLITAIARELGASVRLERLESMTSVGAGLGIVAGALTRGDGPLIDTMKDVGLSY